MSATTNKILAALGALVGTLGVALLLLEEREWLLIVWMSFGLICQVRLLAYVRRYGYMEDEKRNV